ncbi:MAG: hypothetical protein J0M16_04940 [Gammaproteobacteria bacterium]|nr:hypothetical protein [Gammaproteobacteria bacterium]
MTGIVQKIVVRAHERALVFRRGEFRELLKPGVHWRLGLTGALTVERVDVTPAAGRTGLQELLLKSWTPAERERYEVIETRADQIAIVYLNRQLEDILGPGRRVVYRKGVAAVTVTVIGINGATANAAGRLAPRPVRREARDPLAFVV